MLPYFEEEANRSEDLPIQGLQILLMSGVTVTSASQILESSITTKKAIFRLSSSGPGMYTLS